MSQSPESAIEKNSRESYLSAFDELATLIRNGGSFSGRERHCAFLNRGDGKFSDVSGLTGFGLAEDGRGLGLTDWDGDGDIDVWFSNRTAPRIKLLENTVPAESNRWVSFLLEGDPASGVVRDGIGARVEMLLSDGSRRVKTLHAGEGFMSQSSKWLHFGLGSELEIETVQVVWKKGEVEGFDAVVPKRRWHLKQGAGIATAASVRKSVKIEGKSLSLPEPISQARIRLSQPVQIPDLNYQDYQGRSHRLREQSANQKILINLWATWCQPCLAELKEFEAQKEELAKVGVTVVALNVDHLGEDETADTGKQFLEKLGFSGLSGIASPELVASLDSAILKSIYRHHDMPVPISFLIDRGGWLSVIYKGTVDIKQILDDQTTLGKGSDIARKSAIPFPGIWAEKRFVMNPVSYASTYLEGRYFEDARRVLDEFLRESLVPPVQLRNAESRGKAMQLAEVFYLRGEIERIAMNLAKARGHYETSLKYSAKQVPVLNQLIWMLATTKDARVRNGSDAAGYADFMMKAPRASESPSLLGTAAAAYAAAGRFDEAVTLSQKAIAIAGAKGQESVVQTHQTRLKQYQRKMALYL